MGTGVASKPLSLDASFLKISDFVRKLYSSAQLSEYPLKINPQPKEPFNPQIQVQVFLMNYKNPKLKPKNITILKSNNLYSKVI